MKAALVKNITALFMSLIATAVYAVNIQVVSSGGFAGAYKALASAFEAQTGNQLIPAWGLSNGTSKNAIPMRLERGEDIDVVIMTGGSLDELMVQGKLLSGSKVLLANSLIACAVKQGAPKLDISTAAKLKLAFLSAKSMAYSNGASGDYIKNELMNRLYIQKQMASKTRQIAGMSVGEAIASGEVQMGCQQLSELKTVEGISIIGLLPQELGLITPFFGAVAAQSAVPKQAKDLLLFLSSPANAAILERAGLTSATQGH